ncbi:MAG: hypothetical protein U5K27_13760 [Desulfotignum sp.]|nr:hypothetical protein [Desulfotignum sp.]
MQNTRPYSVAWLDCLADKKNLGRALLTVGGFCTDGNLAYHPRKENIRIPFDFPGFVLNNYSVKGFNKLYYSKTIKDISKNKRVTTGQVFFPFGRHWPVGNRIYGKKGFVQIYQVYFCTEVRRLDRACRCS